PAFVAIIHSSFGDYYRVKGDQPKSESFFRQTEKELQQLRAAGDEGLFVASSLLHVQARLGQRGKVEQLAQIILKQAQNDRWEFPFDEEIVARAYTVAGEFDRALPLLQHALTTPGVEALTPAYLRFE